MCDFSCKQSSGSSSRIRAIWTPWTVSAERGASAARSTGQLAQARTGRPGRGRGAEIIPLRLCSPVTRVRTSPGVPSPAAGDGGSTYAPARVGRGERGGARSAAVPRQCLRPARMRSGCGARQATSACYSGSWRVQLGNRRERDVSHFALSSLAGSDPASQRH